VAKRSLLPKSLRILISSGPTQEPLDPVRYLSNNSTGVMGQCLFASAKLRGHRVTLIECPGQARTAGDLYRVLKRLLPGYDALIMAAAVCDVRPKKVSSVKIKKNQLDVIPLVRNPDILKNLSKIKKSKQIFIGFGLESDQIIKKGSDKLKAKSLEAIVLQKVTQRSLPFGRRNIGAFILQKGGAVESFKSVSKNVLAGRVIKLAETLWLDKVTKK
jgi:phosphopantothenoylcysteine decarboxylase / phosphopantothenate---cysteine ligase